MTLPLHPDTLPYLKPGPLLVGLSGGRDSVALLLALAAGGCELCACHVNHGMRGAAADADEAFCRRLCAERAVPLEVVQVDVPALAAAQQQSPETAARAARRAALAAAAEHAGCRAIALAHHADDQAETVLFRMARGAAGPRGMLPVHEAQGFLWLRPLLDVRRESLTRYLQEQGQAWVEDATNAETDAVRNRLRHEVLPALNRAMARDVTTILCRSARVQVDTTVALDEALARLPLTDPQGRLYLPALQGAPPAFIRAVLHRYLALAGVPDLSSALVEAVSAILPPDAPARCPLPGGRLACRKEQRLFVAANAMDIQCTMYNVQWSNSRA